MFCSDARARTEEESVLGMRGVEVTQVLRLCRAARGISRLPSTQSSLTLLLVLTCAEERVEGRGKTL